MAEFNGKKVLLAGLKGDPGPQGPQGEKGEKGEPGTLEGASSVTLEGNSGSKVLVSAEEALPYIVAEAESLSPGKQVLLSLHPAEPLTESISLRVPAEGGTLATQEWADVSYVPLESGRDPRVLPYSIGRTQEESGKRADYVTFMSSTFGQPIGNAPMMQFYSDGQLIWSLWPTAININRTKLQLNFPIGEVNQNSVFETFATREWSQENVAQKVLEPGWGDGEALPQSVVSNMAAWPSDSPGVDVMVQRCGLGAFVPQDGKRYECLFSIGGTLYLTSFLVSGESATFDTGNREALKPGDIVTANGVTMMIRQAVGTGAAKNIWDIAVPLRGRFPVMPDMPKGGTLQNMRDCDIRLATAAGQSFGVQFKSLRNCSVYVDTTEYDGSKDLEAFQATFHGDNYGAFPVLPSVYTTQNDMMLEYIKINARVADGSGRHTPRQVKYTQLVVTQPAEGKADSSCYRNVWLYQEDTERATWQDLDGNWHTQRYSWRFEFAQSGMVTTEFIPYLVDATAPAEASQAAAISTMSLSEPANPDEPLVSVPVDREAVGCFTLDEQGRTIDAFTGEVVSG